MESDRISSLKVGSYWTSHDDGMIILITEVDNVKKCVYFDILNLRDGIITVKRFDNTMEEFFHDRELIAMDEV